MLYESYERRVYRSFSILKQIIKYRKIIIAIVSAIVLLSGTYSVTKGMVYDVEVPTVVTFGDDFEVSSKSIFSKITYEYKEVGTDQWVNEKPLRTGEYEVRITTTQVLGKAKTSVYPFVIESKDTLLTIENTNIQFGSDPVLTATLYGDDYISDASFIYQDLSLTETYVDVENVVILDALGNDVTDSYTFDYHLTQVTFVPRQLVIQPVESTKVYDGTAITSNDAEIVSGSLLEGHRIEITTSGSLVDVGSIENSIVTYVIYDGDIDVTANYHVSLESSTLHITKRAITFSSSSSDIIYDGTSLSNQNFDITKGSLVLGETAMVSSYQDITNVGEIPNTLTFMIMDGETDVTPNYEITYDVGVLTVLPRPITFTTGSFQKIYDGVPLSSLVFEVTSGTFVSGQSAIIDDSTEITFVGSSYNHLSILIFDGTTDVSMNYQITYVEGLLEVISKQITITTLSQVFTYNGLDNSNPMFEFSVGGILDNEDAIVESFSAIMNVGETANVLDIHIYDGDEDLTDNYEITYIEGVLSVVPLEITIETSSADTIYNAQSFYSNDFEVIEGQIVEGHHFNLISNTEITNVGSTLNILDVQIFEGEVDKTSNYDIIYVLGTLEVFQRPISIQLVDQTKVYDGVALTSIEYEITSALGLVFDHNLVITSSGVQTNVGTSINSIVSATIMSGSIDVSSNYEMTFVDGSLTVTKRPITITTEGAEKVYDGTALYNQNYTVSESGIVLNQTSSVLTYTEIMNVGEILNGLDVHIYDGSDDVTDNYEITYIEGLLKVTPRPITIHLTDQTKVYDGLALTSIETEITSALGLVLDHNLVITSSGVQTNVGTSINSILSATIMSGSIDVSSNYEMTFVDGSLTVTKRPITITTEGAEKVYDGTALYNQNYTVSESGIVLNQTSSLLTYTEIMNVGEILNSLDVHIYDGSDDVTYNYEITYIEGLLKVTPRPIKITKIN